MGEDVRQVEQRDIILRQRFHINFVITRAGTPHEGQVARTICENVRPDIGTQDQQRIRVFDMLGLHFHGVQIIPVGRVIPPGSVFHNIVVLDERAGIHRPEAQVAIGAAAIGIQEIPSDRYPKRSH